MRSALLVAAGLLPAVHGQSGQNPEQFVNTLGGTDSRYDLSHGNLLPLIAVPWGFNAWAPQTDNDATWASWWFHPSDVRFFGIRCTHQPSPWIGDYGDFRVSATITDPDHSDPWQFSGYKPSESAWTPYYFNASLIAYGNRNGFTTVEFTPTNHGAIMRVRFPPATSGPVSDGYNQTRRIIVAMPSQFDTVNVAQMAGTPTITGYTTSNNGGVPSGFAHYFTVQLSGGDDGTGSLNPLSAQVVNSNGNLFAYVDFDQNDASANNITVRIATSFISSTQAQTNFAAEVAGQTFDAVMTAAQMAWRSTLSRALVVDVGSTYTPEQQREFLVTFYSCLYRGSLFPRNLAETLSNGSVVHWSPFTGGVYPGPMSVDSGFWDAYRTVYPALSIINPSRVGVQIEGWVNGYKESGWLCKWCSPAHRGSMVGTMGDLSLADAIVKQIPGFDVAAAYAAIRQDAFVVPPTSPIVGRTCLSAYLQNGYIPRGAPSQQGTCYEVVARTQNYWLSDYAIAQAAKALGNTADANILLARTQNFSQLFDNSTGFFRSRNPDGSWTEPFDEFAWGGDYTEAGPWQYRFYVPYAPLGVAALYQAAGLDMCDTIDQFQTMPPLFHLGAYGSEIHEQTEMAVIIGSQWELNNQPVHHVPYMYIGADTSVAGSCASRGQAMIRKSLVELYTADADMFCGDEDNGEVALWYVLGAMGLYSLVPGTPDYLLGSPLFAHLSITLDNNATLEIVAVNNSATNIYVSGVTWNGAPVSGVSVSYFDIMKGGTLAFTMTDTPATAQAPRTSAKRPHLRAGRKAGVHRP